MISTSNLQAFDTTFNHVGGNQFNLGDHATVTVNHQVAEYVPPRRFNGAPIDLLGTIFTGRLRELSFLSHLFDKENVSTEEDIPTRCAVYGMPGVGKTKLVLRFAQMVFAQFLYSHIFWMSATATDKIIEGMAKILDIVGHPERTRSEHSAKLTAARLWLEDPQPSDSVRWLLILDNVDMSVLEFLYEHLPQRNVKGNILFTTRAADIADALVRVSGGRHSTLELRVPDLVDTTHLLFSSAGIDASTVTPTQKSQAEALAQTLGSLPLAIVQAASFMKQTAATLDTMLQISKSERKVEMIEWKSDLATDQQRSVVATFDTLLDQLERDFPESYNVLRVLSFLDPENMPLGMLTDGARMSSSLPVQPLPGKLKHESNMITRIMRRIPFQRSFEHRFQNDTNESLNPTHSSPELRSLASLILSSTSFPKALLKLQSLSLVEPLSHDGQSSMRMHDLIHFLTRERVKRHVAYQEWLDSTASLICGALQRVGHPESPQWWPECEKLMPHIRSLSKVWTGVEGVNLQLVDADVRLARYLNSRGRYDDAERLCERSVGIFRKQLGEKHKDTLEALHVLADVYDNQGRFADAEEALKHILALRKKILGVDHGRTVSTMNDLAVAYYRKDRYKEAEELFKRVLAVREKKLGPDHHDTLTTMNNLANVYESQKRYDEAEELLECALTLEEKTLGSDHIHTLTTANNLALVYRSKAKYVDAEKLFKLALVCREQHLGPIHPDTLTTVMDLAFLYQQERRNDEAERFYLRAFMGRKQQLGANHPATLRCAVSFVDFYRSQGRNREADALLERQ